MYGLGTDKNTAPCISDFLT